MNGFYESAFSEYENIPQHFTQLNPLTPPPTPLLSPCTHYMRLVVASPNGPYSSLFLSFSKLSSVLLSLDVKYGCVCGSVWVMGGLCVLWVLCGEVVCGVAL